MSAPSLADLTPGHVPALETRLLLHIHRLAVANRAATGDRGHQWLIAAIDAELTRRGVWK